MDLSRLAVEVPTPLLFKVTHVLEGTSAIDKKRRALLNFEKFNSDTPTTAATTTTTTSNVVNWETSPTMAAVAPPPPETANEEEREGEVVVVAPTLELKPTSLFAQASSPSSMASPSAGAEPLHKAFDVARLKVGYGWAGIGHKMLATAPTLQEMNQKELERCKRSIAFRK